MIIIQVICFPEKAAEQLKEEISVKYVFLQVPHDHDDVDDDDLDYDNVDDDDLDYDNVDHHHDHDFLRPRRK